MSCLVTMERMIELKFTTKDITLISLFVALITIGSKITIPSPIVPFTLQWMFVALSGMLLGSRLAPISVIVYILLGLLGLPVFTKGGGISYILSPTFGYLIGFIPASFIIGKAVERMENKIKFWRIMIAMTCALFVLYSIGVSYMYVVATMYLCKSMSLTNAIWYGAALFIPTDLLSATFCSIFGVKAARQVRTIVNSQ